MQNPIQRFEDRFNAPVQPGQDTRHVPRRVQAIQHLSVWRRQGADQEDYWLRQLIGEGFQQMISLALPKAPAVEVLPATAEMWLNMMSDMDLCQELDHQRIAKAFRLMHTKLREWPQIIDLIDHLPARPQKAQAAPQRTEEQHAQGASKLQDILNSLGKEQEDEPV